MQLEILTEADLQKFKTELFDELKKMNVGGSAIFDQRKWLRSAEVRKLLNISAGTLQNLRVNGTLPFKKVGSIFYYAYADISKLMGQGGDI
jgi:hypothetical protein